jgi:exopolysaccharide biosynthesis polyprenyl glycosylphosphotransferase
MLKERAKVLNLFVFAADLAWVAVAFLGAFWLRDGVLPSIGWFEGRLYPLKDYLPLLALALGVWGTFLLFSDQYRSHRTVPLLQEAWDLLRANAGAAISFVLILYAARLDEQLLGHDRVSRLWIGLFPVLAFILLLAFRLGLRLTSRYVRAKGFNYRTVLIVGSGPAARDIAQSIDAHRYWGFRIVGFVTAGEDGDDLRGTRSGLGELPHPVLGSLADLSRVLEESIVDDVIFALGRRAFERVEDLVLSLQEQGIRVRFALDLFPHAKAKVDLEDLDGTPLLTFSTTPNRPIQLLAKRFIDVALSGLLLLIAAPVVGLVAVLIRITTGGSIIFRQTRCGLNGRSFTLYKFRTMVEDAEERRRELLHLNEMKGPVFKLRFDPRVTRVGRFLRKFSLDEIPQFWNVLRGDMSLVGPRPPIPDEVAQYQRWQRRRLAMKPGLTCLWQISGRNHVDFDQWMRLDLEYIDNWSPGLDLKILLKTIPVVLSGKGAS